MPFRCYNLRSGSLEGGKNREQLPVFWCQFYRFLPVLWTVSAQFLSFPLCGLPVIPASDPARPRPSSLPPVSTSLTGGPGSWSCHFCLFSSDKRFSALGFGARIPPKYEVGEPWAGTPSFYPLQPRKNPSCHRSLLRWGWREGRPWLWPETDCWPLRGWSFRHGACSYQKGTIQLLT